MNAPVAGVKTSADLPADVDSAKLRAKGGMAQLSPRLRAVALGARTLDALAPAFTARLMLRHFTRPRSRPGSDYRHLLPAGAQRLRVRHGSKDLTLWAWGDSGPAVLLVHGWEDHSGSMLPFVAPLRERGYRVFALDSPGHGLSSRGATHLLDCSYAVARVMLEYGPFDSIVAHSFGAAAVCHMLSILPEYQPRRMVLVSPMRDMEQHLQVFADIALLSAARRDRLRDMATQVVGSPLNGVGSFAVLPALAIPGLIIHDCDDPVIPHAVGQSAATCWNSATLFSTRGLGHRRILRCPRVLAEVMCLHESG